VTSGIVISSAGTSSPASTTEGSVSSGSHLYSGSLILLTCLASCWLSLCCHS
jgi:hypothetical protein